MLDPGTIRGILLCKGHTYASLARELGVSRQAVRHVATGMYASPRIRSRIAEVLGLSPDDIWPSSRDTESSPQQPSRSISDPEQVLTTNPDAEAA